MVGVASLLSGFFAQTEHISLVMQHFLPNEKFFNLHHSVLSIQVYADLSREPRFSLTGVNCEMLGCSVYSVNCTGGPVGGAGSGTQKIQVLLLVLLLNSCVVLGMPFSLFCF